MGFGKDAIAPYGPRSIGNALEKGLRPIPVHCFLSANDFNLTVSDELAFARLCCLVC
jgi:hypothetical protein